MRASICLEARFRGDDGSITAFVVLSTVALVAFAGLVVDGGYAMAARQEAANVAEQAARAGADALARDQLRAGGPPTLDRAAATAAAQGFLLAAGQHGEVAVVGDKVTVRVSRRTAVLSIVGINWLVGSARASARGLIGIDEVEEAP